MSQVESDRAVSQTRAEAAAWVVEQVRALGMSPNPASRLERMRRVLERGLVPFDDPQFLIALEAMREVQELAFVFGQAGGHLGAPKYLALVKDLLKDSVLPQDDRQKSPGRDAQFELYLAATCQHGGLSPVGYEEPDITCTVDGVKFGIAAKRLKSGTSSAVREHVKKGADQIKRAGTPASLPSTSPWRGTRTISRSLLRSRARCSRWWQQRGTGSFSRPTSRTSPGGSKAPTCGRCWYLTPGSAFDLTGHGVWTGHCAGCRRRRVMSRLSANTRRFTKAS
jgi:hypothetical protein